MALTQAAVIKLILEYIGGSKLKGTPTVVSSGRELVAKAISLKPRLSALVGELGSTAEAIRNKLLQNPVTPQLAIAHDYVQSFGNLVNDSSKLTGSHKATIVAALNDVTTNLNLYEQHTDILSGVTVLNQFEQIENASSNNASFLGGVSANAILSQINTNSSAISNFDALFGNTASAAISANSAATYANLASIAAGQAVNAVAIASTSANIASAAATTAGTAANTTLTFLTAANTAKDQAQTAATLAIAAANSALADANIASSSAILAATSANTASGAAAASASNAAFAATSANNSATSASAALAASISAAATASGIASSLFPSDFSADNTHFYIADTGTFSFSTANGVGRILSVTTGNNEIFPLKFQPVIGNRRFRAIARVRRSVANSATGNSSITFTSYTSDATDAGSGAIDLVPLAVVGYPITYNHNTTQSFVEIAADFQVNSSPSFPFIRPKLSLVRGSAGQLDVVSYKFFDVTEASDAAASAAAAANSASYAFAQANAANQYATTAQTSAIAANTSSGQANVFATSAASSAASANTNSSAASTSAGLAAGSAGAANTFANAAASSATTASSAANAASSNAAVAQASAISANASASMANTSAAAAIVSANSAAASATGANTSATAAAGSALTANTKASDASISQLAAANSATNANTSAASAATNTTLAANSALNANTSATAAAVSATSANTSANNSLNSSTAAQTSALASNTSAGQANSSAIAAGVSMAQSSTLANSASTSASAAAASVVSANSAANTALTAAYTMFPSTFAQQGTFFSNTGTGVVPASLSATVFTVEPTYGTVVQANNAGNFNIFTKGYVGSTPNRRYRATATVRVKTDSTSGSLVQFFVDWYSLSSTFALVSNTNGTSAITTTASAANGVITLSSDYIVGATSPTPFARPRIALVSQGIAPFNAVAQFISFQVTDVTNVVDSQNFAAASATSASQANTSANNSAVAATAASTSAVAANTSAGLANTSAAAAAVSSTSAANSASTANASAASAVSAAALAANSATLAGGFSNAAAGSATLAQTFSNTAGTSANAASASAVTASSAANSIQAAAALTFPNDFSQDGRFWTFAPATASPSPLTAGTFPIEPGIGKVWQATAADGAIAIVYSIGRIKPVAGRKYRVTAVVKQKVDGTGGAATRAGCDFSLALDSTYNVVVANGVSSTPAGVSSNRTLVVSDGVQTVVGDFVASTTPTAYIVPRVFVNYNNLGVGTVGTAQIISIKIEDITDSASAQNFANAAATSATIAQTSANNANQYATTAQSYSLNANTSQTAAANSASAADISQSAASANAAAAAISQSDANTSASFAASSAALAANSATLAGGYAAAAANSSTFANSAANSAGNFASIASTAAISAQSSVNVVVPNRPSKQNNYITIGMYTPVNQFPDSVPTLLNYPALGFTSVNVANEGEVLESPGTQFISIGTRGWFSVTSGRIFQCNVRCSIASAASSIAGAIHIGFGAYDAAGTYLGWTDSTVNTTFKQSDGWLNYSVSVTSAAFLAAFATAAYIRAVVYVVSNNIKRVAVVELLDITSVSAANGAAQAAVTSAAAANTAANTAGNFASAAQGFALQANTSQAAANVFAQAASTFAVSANSSAANAAASASLAASVANGNSADVTQLQGAVASLQGKTQAFWNVTTNAGTARTFISAEATTSSNTLTSDIAFGAKEIFIFNDVDGSWIKALEVSNGNVKVYGNFSANQITTGVLNVGLINAGAINATMIASNGVNLSNINRAQFSSYGSDSDAGTYSINVGTSVGTQVITNIPGFGGTQYIGPGGTLTIELIGFVQIVGPTVAYWDDPGDTWLECWVNNPDTGIIFASAILRSTGTSSGRYVNITNPTNTTGAVVSWGVRMVRGSTNYTYHTDPGQPDDTVVTSRSGGINTRAMSATVRWSAF